MRVRRARKILVRTNTYRIRRSVARIKQRSRHRPSASRTLALNGPFDEVGGDPTPTARGQRHTEFKRRTHKKRRQRIKPRPDGDNDCAGAEGHQRSALKFGLRVHGSS
jgi:hypothetical protein